MEGFVWLMPVVVIGGLTMVKVVTEPDLEAPDPLVPGKPAPVYPPEIAVYQKNRDITAAPDEEAEPPAQMKRYKPAAPPFDGTPPQWVKTDDLPTNNSEVMGLWDLFFDNKLEAANAGAEQEAAKQPKNLQLRFLRGEIARELGQLKEAVEQYRYVIKHQPGCLEAYMKLGSVLMDLGQFDAALEALNKAEAIGQDPEVHLNRAIALMDANKIDLAEWDLWQKVKADPRDGGAYFNLAAIYSQRRKVDLAIKMLRMAARDPEVFAERLNQKEIRWDPLFSPLRSSMTFRKYMKRLPQTPIRLYKLPTQEEPPPPEDEPEPAPDDPAPTDEDPPPAGGPSADAGGGGDPPADATAKQRGSN